MHASNDRDQFAPTRPPGRLRAVALAVLVHAALLGALTWGVNWKTSADMPAVEAEIWDRVPQQAAPRDVPPPPVPQPDPTPPPPPPPPAPAPPPPPPPPPKAEPDTREADIALERDKKRLEQEKKERQQQAEREKRERERKEQLEEDKKERLQKEKEKEQREKADKAEREKAEKERREKQAEQDRQEQQKKQAEDKRKAEEKRKAEAAQAKQAEAQRQENLRRMQGLAGATGGENATGTAQRSAGPSGSYGGKVAAKVRPNIVYPDALSDNPRTEVEVRASPDGTIVGTRVTKSSGNKAWDDAVVRALQKTETLPRDVDGRVPSSLVIGFRPQD